MICLGRCSLYLFTNGHGLQIRASGTLPPTSILLLYGELLEEVLFPLI